MSDPKLLTSNKLEDTLLDIIVCPIDKQPLIYSYIDDINSRILANIRINRYYEIKDSIPILLEEESIDINNNEIEILKRNTIRTTGK